MTDVHAQTYRFDLQLLLGNPNQQFAGIGAIEQFKKCRQHIVEAIDNLFAGRNLSGH
jgi:hypothetical protein